MISQADFDLAAHDYDVAFTNSNIGVLQRKQVYLYLNKLILDKKKLNILELNCGTGHDALYMAGLGHRVLATDVSTEMLAVAKKKGKQLDLQFKRLDLNQLVSSELSGPYDLIFSNFGGLNCIDKNSFNRLAKIIAEHLLPDGRFVGVIMPRRCVWETLYFLGRGKFKSAFRRYRVKTTANVSNSRFDIWYYSPQRVEQFFKKNMEVEEIKPIGLFVPPSYLEHFFTNKHYFLRLLSKLDTFMAKWRWQSNYADHYYIQFKLK